MLCKFSYMFYLLPDKICEIKENSIQKLSFNILDLDEKQIYFGPETELINSKVK